MRRPILPAIRRPVDDPESAKPLPLRLPDFVVIGAMRAGTTTLVRRLEHVDGITLPSVKETHFFARDEAWSRGPEWYGSLFEGCSGITGEASPGYADAANADIVAQRMHGLIPGVRLIYALRHPVERMRSTYRHHVLRARESRPFPVASQDLDGHYVAGSLYGRVLTAYRREFPAEQMLLYKVEDLDAPGSPVWTQILDHIGAESSAMPSARYNESAEATQFTPALLWLYERGRIPSTRLPAPLRKLGRRLLTRRPEKRSDLLETAEGPVSQQLLDLFHEDQEVMRRLGVDPSLVWDDRSLQAPPEHRER